MVVRRGGFCCLLFMILVTVSSAGASEENSIAPDEPQQADFQQMGQTKETDEIFKYEKKDRDTLLQFKGTGAGRSHDNADTGTFGLEALYGQLFHKVEEKYTGYYFFSAKIESDNRQRLNATLGYFLPSIGGEAKMTYRLLNAEVKETLGVDGGIDVLAGQEFEENALEQGLGLLYKKRFKIVIREMAFKYAYSHLGGDSVDLGQFNLDSDSRWRRVTTEAGFGDVDTHEATIKVAAGSDTIDNPVVKGLRLDVVAGYQDVHYDGFRGSEDISDSGFTGTVQLQACTPAGLFKGGYMDSEASKTAYGAYQLGGLDFYYKNIDYPYGEDEEVLGVGFIVDVFDTDSSLDPSCPRLFYPSDSGYDNVSQMYHIDWLASDEFTAKPKVRVIYEEVFGVSRLGLPGNVSIDGSVPRLIVDTGCDQRGVRSVNPSSASSAFSVDGSNVNVSMADLPTNTGSVTARIDDACCGDTEVTVETVVGQTLAVNSVRVREQVGCQPSATTSSGTVPGSCLIAGSLCTPGVSTCCPGLICLMSVTGGPFTCQ